MIRQVLFAKKFTLPSKTANVLQSVTMAYAFAENGVRTTLFPGFKEQNYDLKEAYSLLSVPDINIVPSSGSHKGLYGINFRLRLMKAWLTAKPGTIFYTRDIKEGLFLARLKRRTGIARPFFFEMHEVLAEQHERRQTGIAALYRQQEEELLEQVDGVISISALLTEDIHRVYAPKAPIFTAPMGFNPHIFSPIDNVDLSEKITLAYVGSLYEGKGVHNLLEAMTHLPENFHLKIMGGNPQKELDKLKNNAEKYKGRVTFTGHLTPLHVAKELASCQIFVIPQCTEAEFFSPIKLYEAMGMALPIIATPVPTIKAAVTHGQEAFLADDTTPEALAQAALKLTGQPELVQTMQEHVRQHAKQFSWKHRAKDCLDFMGKTVHQTAQ